MFFLSNVFITTEWYSEKPNCLSISLIWAWTSSDLLRILSPNSRSNNAVSSFAIASYLNKLKLNENFIDLRQTNPYEFILLQDNNRLEFGNQITIAKKNNRKHIEI